MVESVRLLGDHCPRCDYVQRAGREECGRCGQPLDEAEAAAEARAAPLDPGASAAAGHLRELRNWAVGGHGGPLAPVALGVVLGWLTIFFALRSPVMAGQENPTLVHHLIDMANLVFHEAGHWILAPFGRFLSVLGGTLFEIGVPAVCLAEFVRRRDRTGAAATLWWTGQSLTGVAIYAADARAGRLVLLGGRTGRESPGTHDWHNLLEWTGLLGADVAIGWLFHLLGATLMVAAVAWCGARAWRSYRVPTDSRAGLEAGAGG